MGLVVVLILVAVVLGIIGAAAEGLGYLLAVAVLLFVGTLAAAAVLLPRGHRRGKRRRTLR
ncbi:hypothetical protein [Streptomyces sp. H27-C3]|uniref:hypothetical protein n=1 Tax=Streptomyces sp. H27-C3 TaxID=3046305 RepID=UPI0024BA86B8|nr:hypothetical protein [Streptomyces sp. H27-C3]MDJ0464276.1 hypothetical protein [Streptomyces sp. H27-C3]